MQSTAFVDGASPVGDVELDENEEWLKSALELSLPTTTRVQTFATNAAYELNQAVLDDAEEGIYGLNEKGITTFVNPAAHRMTGWSMGDLKGLSQHSMLHHSRHDGSHYPVEECPIYKVLSEGVQQQRDDEVFWRKDGTCFPVAYTSTPVLRHGKPYGAVIVFCDITLRVQAEAWQQSKAHVIRSLRQRAPMLHCAARIGQAFSIFLGSRHAQRGHGIIRYPHGHTGAAAESS